MIKYTQQSFHKNCKFMFTSIYNRILNYCNSIFQNRKKDERGVCKMVYRFIATTLFNGNKRLTMHSYREQMRNHNGRQYHLQSGIGRQATGNIVYLLLMQGKTHRLQNQLDLSVRIDRILAPQ